MHRILAIVAAIAVALPPPAASQPVGSCVGGHYRLIRLPFDPVAINDLGQIAGTTAYHRAGVWTADTGLQEPSLPSGFSRSEAVAINNSGDLVGIAITANSSKHTAFLVKNGNQLLLSGHQSKPFAINDADQVAGEAVDKSGVAQPVIWDPTHRRKLGACCGGTALGINNAGTVVGQRYDAQGQYSAFVWDTSHGLQPIVYVGAFSSAVAINDRGEILIRTFSPDAVYLARPGQTPSKLKLSPKFPSEPKALSGCGAIVGAAGPYSDACRAFVWDESHGFRDLNDLVPPGSGWKLETATGINSRGEIVGTGDFRGEEDAGFLLIPE